MKDLKLLSSLDKIIDRMSSIFNLQGLFGNSYTYKMNRKNMVKNIIDLVLNHNNYLTKISYLLNRDKIIENYNINKNLSNFYIFNI